MARLKDTRTGPPGGWRYVQPETECEIIASSFPELIEKVQIHRRYKHVGSIELDTMMLDVERQLCSGLEPRFCTAEPGENFMPVVDEPGGLTTSKVTAATIAFIAFLKGALEIVPKSESERRASICRGCRFNRNADGCGACNALFAIVEAAIPAKRLEPGLKACAACGCMLKAKVLMPASVIAESNRGRNVSYPDHCWQQTQSPCPTT